MSALHESTRNHLGHSIGGALLAGGMLLAVPAAIATAAPGVNGRPPLKPAKAVEKIQTAGDAVFDTHPGLDGTGFGSLYHGVFGRSAVNNQAFTGDPTATGTNGLYAGVRNVVPRAGTCNIVVQVGCN
jgi:hypothetical protein